MMYRFIYQRYECNRLVPAVLISNYGTNASIKNKNGFEVLAYTDSVVDEILSNEDTLFYKIETDMGHLTGYFSLNTHFRDGFIPNFELRPNYEQFRTEIYNEILNFVQSGDWKIDQLT